MSYFYPLQTIILTITHKFNASKKAPPPKAQMPRKDRLFYRKICFLCLKIAKTYLKNNKKRRTGTISCILFCVSLWLKRSDSNTRMTESEDYDKVKNSRFLTFFYQKTPVLLIQSKEFPRLSPIKKRRNEESFAPLFLVVHVKL